MHKDTLISGVNYAYNNILESSMSQEQMENQKKIILDKIEKGEIRDIDQVMDMFDLLNEGGSECC